MFSIALANLSCAGFINGEWNAPFTGSNKALFAPAAFNASQAFSTAAVSPEITS